MLFSDLAGFTTFASRRRPPKWRGAQHLLRDRRPVDLAPVRRRAREVHRRRDDGHVQLARRPARPRGARGRRGARPPGGDDRVADANPGWPRLRVGVNSGEALVREMGGHGFVAYAVVGDTVNTAARLESQAPVGGVLIGSRHAELVPDGSGPGRSRTAREGQGGASTPSSCTRFPDRQPRQGAVHERADRHGKRDGRRARRGRRAASPDRAP